MRILALADIHGYEYTPYFVEEIESLYDFDVIMIAGDITNFGPAEFAKELLDSLPKKVIAVPGNCDPVGTVKAIEKSKGINAHKKRIRLENYTVIGLGGTDGKGFSMGITFTAEDVNNLLKECNGCIFLTHQPPFGILDEVGHRHVGSKILRTALDKITPSLVISGHIHEARGYEIRNNTIFVNPGPTRMGYAAIIDMKSREVLMIEK